MTAPYFFPYVFGYNDAARAGGGMSYQMGQAFPLYKYTKDIKPTFNTYLTQVRANHTIKMGGEAVFEGLPIKRPFHARKGNFVFAAQHGSGIPWEEGRGLNATTGFPYASFLTGLELNSLTTPPRLERPPRQSPARLLPAGHLEGHP